jgi:hypothetical protein
MPGFIKQIVFLSLAGVIIFGVLPEAKAQSRMGMMMGRQQMMMNSGMMNTGMNPGMMNIGMNPSFFLMNPGVTSPAMGFPTFPGLRQRWPWWWGYGGGMYLGYGLGGYGYGGFYPADYSGNDSQVGYSAPRRRRPKDDDATPTLTPEQERERIHQLELAWSRGNLSELETRSATALNILLADLQQLQAQGIAGPETALDEEGLQHINVVVGRSYGHVAVLRDDGRIRWPDALTGPEFARERNLISSLAPKAVEATKRAETIDLGEMTGALAVMQYKLASHISDMPMPAYIRVKRFLTSLGDAVRLLRQPDAGNYFNQTYAAKGKNVAELVQHMTQLNLRFAPAMEGDEPFYKVLHQALAKYDVAARRQQVARK